jgi:CSLREA domain-containing protein
MNRIVSRLPLSTSIAAIIVAVVIASLLVHTRTALAMVSSFTVNSTADVADANPGDGVCDDGSGNCTLRAAIMESDFSGGANVITVPAGTYTLTGPYDDEYNGAGATLESGDLDIVDLSAFSLPLLTSVTINGAGASSTIINGAGVDRVFDINNFAVGGAAINVTLSGLTIRNGNAPTTPDGYNESGGGIQFDGFDNQTTFQPTGTLTISNCNITNNTSAGQGGGILAIFGSLVVNGSQISGNTTTKAAGGGISYDASAFAGLRTLTITNSQISTNHANNGTFGSGGGVWEAGNANKTINYNSITGNTAAVFGGGVLNGNGTLTLNYNVIVGNTATANPTSSGFRSNSGAVSVVNDWWGCNQGPGSAPCDRSSVTVPNWLTLSHTATPNTVATNTSTTLQADFYTNNSNAVVLPTDLVALNGRAVLFNNAVLGTISAADTQIMNGKANATYTAGNTGGTGSADATVDHQTVTALINIAQAPGVTVNPTDQTACDGASVSFTAASSGFPPPTVQWQVSTGGPFTDIPGATSNTLTFTATLAANGNKYRAVFTNAGGSDTTTAATLTVISAPTITQNPTNVTTCNGGTATFTAAASDSTGVQWQVSTNGGALFTPIPGANSTTLSFTASSAQNGNQYRAVFSNSCGNATTSAATLTIQPATTTTDPADATVCQGATANFSTTAGGTGPFTYAWTVDGSAAGTNSPSLSVDTTSLSVGNHTVSVTTTGACGSASQSATLTVRANTTTTDPPDQTVCKGATASFSTTASGTGPFTYAWTVDGSPAGNTSSINVPTGSLSVGNHTVAVTTTGTCGSASQSATLTVNANTTTTDPSDATVCQGATAAFSTTAGGTGPFSYAWTVDGSAAGTDSPNLSVDTTSLSVGSHTVTVTTTGACGSASQSATLTVQENTTATTPGDQAVCQGATAGFSTTASGTGLSYAWTVDGSSFGGNTSSISVPTGSLSVGNHPVTVTVSGTCGNVTKNATLTVQENTTATTPGDQTVCQGATAGFSTTASGTGLSYAWTVDGSSFGGNTSSISVPTGSLSVGNHPVTVTVSGTCGSVTKNATLTVQENTTATTPGDQTVCQGAMASFSTTASGNGTIHYSWTVDGSTFGGDTSSISVPTGSLSVGNHPVTVTVSGTCGSVTKNATLTVNANTTTTDPADVATCEGATASFTTNASGTGPFSFVWKQGVVPIVSGGRFTITNTSTSSTLTISNVQGSDAGTYTVETTGACGTASQSANLTVDSSPPVIVLNGNTITMWPPNHQYRTINVTDLVSGVTDSCDNLSASSVTIASVTSDEVEDAPSGGDGNTLNDIVISCDRHSVKLRQERDGNLNGRVYTVVFTVTDSQGHVGTATAKISVPVNQNGAAAVDSGPHYAVATATCP